jgi:hypothetical protein
LRIFTNERVRTSSGVSRLVDGFFGDRAAVHRAQEVVQQSPSGRGIIEHVSDERPAPPSARSSSAAGRGVETFEEERIDRCEARRQLRRVKIPSLIEPVDEGVADVLACSARLDARRRRIRSA